jgi:hypothetical protein
MVGGIGVRDGVAVGVGTVGENVRVKIEVAVGSEVFVPVAVWVGVVKRSANAWIVISRSTLRVGVGEPPPVFGINRSESYSFCVAARDIMTGIPNGIAHAAMITT